MMNRGLEEAPNCEISRYMTAPPPRETREMFFRPIRSGVDDQPIRPAMFAAESSATKPAAAETDTGVEVSAKKSVIIGAAFSRMPMPAVTFMHRTTHRHQNCGVRTAL